MIKLTKKYLTNYDSPTLWHEVNGIYYHQFFFDNVFVWIDYDKENDEATLNFQDDEGAWKDQNKFTIAEMNTLFKPENLKKYLNEDQ